MSWRNTISTDHTIHDNTFFTVQGCMECISHVSNPLTLGKCGSNSKCVIPEHRFRIKFSGTSCENDLRRMSQKTFVDDLILVQVMAWCRQATSHYLGQLWPRSISSYGVTMLQLVNIFLLCGNQISNRPLLSIYPYHTGVLHWYQWPLLLTWFNFNPSMDK